MPEISNILVWLILGGISGWIASKIAGKDAEMGFGLNLVVGILGAFIGGWVAGLFGLGPATGLNLWSFVISILGAVILLGIISVFKRKT
ncbi:GlsB/YeaQ/YmgE family stress response membrane protein [Mobilitalea sibirica]|uniref:GlsB/YeaQ/YmgE family stress response membrane protein n=1 Tax=Mobilitalea sibirica TaxID=1462919 RepID=A0A8J7H7H4_9FIRM|nr:GlsB/YeaQ/YmgE family stress response membrane protein [Mobilitalea sibirica]MBH1941176.1 GlsB/YeaQ/YmgE family stress response membrane protein [Mobilitalea sibirica]